MLDIDKKQFNFILTVLVNYKAHYGSQSKKIKKGSYFIQEE